jgi:uncharacterized protein
MADISVHIPAHDVRLAGTLCLPPQSDAFATAILLPGSGHHDRDETIGQLKPFATIADHLKRVCIASLRFDGRGMGQSGGSTETVDFRSKVEDALAVRHWLIEQRGIDAQRLLFIGHSEGGLVGAAAAAEKPTVLAMLSGLAEPVAATLHSLAETQSRAIGATPRQIVHERAMNEAAFAIAASPGEPQRERLAGLFASFLASWPDRDEPLSEADRSAAAESMAGTLLAPDFRSLLQQDPPAYLRRLARPALAMFGELDCQVRPDTNLAAFREATARNPRATAIVLAGHNHLYQEAVTGQIDEYETLGASPSGMALDALTGWIRDVFRV